MIALFASLVLQGTAPEIMFVRHGETVANATGRYNSKTINTFSEKGKSQVASLTPKLIKAGKFDVILVSPSERALRTVAPYLRATNQRALVWPEWYECCTGRDKSQAMPGKFTWATKFTLPKDIASLYRVDPVFNRLPSSPKFADGVAQVKAGTLRMSKDFIKPGARILVVGHSGAGGVMMEVLEGKTRFGRKHPENAKPTLYRKSDAGTWRLTHFD
jgi:broad specificity phosphatase PhoE